MQNELPEWAMEEAAALRSAVIWKSNASNEVIARALVAAERRGIERAAKVAEDQAEGWTAGDNNGEFYEFEASACLSVAAAIRSLGEKT